MLGALDPAALRMLLVFALAALALVLGFIALLKQRTYLDAKTQKPVQIDIPMFGKNIIMRTNYPALAFVLLAFVFVIWALQTEPPSEKTEVDWSVEGWFTDPKINDWNRAGRLELFPSPKIVNPGQPVDRNGHFIVIVKIDKNESFEGVVQTITYTHREGQVVINTAQEYAAWEKRQENCKLESATQTTRKYKAIPLGRFQGNTQ